MTYMHCHEFVRLCPVCVKQQPNIGKQKGAEKPIILEKFRNQFQVDLIDMRTKPAKNMYQKIMRYIITVKDHLTGFVALSCIPKKSNFCKLQTTIIVWAHCSLHIPYG